MHHRTITTAAALLLLGASAASAQAPLRYMGMPAKVLYNTADSVTSTIMGGPTGSMVTTIGSTSILELELHPVGDSTHVISTLKEIKGMIEAMGQSMDLPVPPTATEPSEFMLSRDGRTRHVKGSGGVDVARGSTATDAISRMFIHLPAKSLKIGDTWADTVNETTDTIGMKMNLSGVTNTTYAADSTVDGRKVKVLRSTADLTMKMTGNMNGMEMSQDVKGKTVSLALFDPAANIVVYIRDETTMAGKLDAPAAGMTGIDISQNIRRTLRIAK